MSKDSLVTLFALIAALNACSASSPTAPSTDGIGAPRVESSISSPPSGSSQGQSSAATSASVNTGSPKYGGKFYGNWCGPGWSGGKTGTSGTATPVDELDQQCGYHDRAYAAADAYWSQSYNRAASSAAKKQACDSWYSAYRSADVALTSAARALPHLAGTVTSHRPDGWHYDPNIFGVHPRSTGQRIDYRDAAIITGNSGLFKAPGCRR